MTPAGAFVDPFAIGNPAALTALDVACAMPLGSRVVRQRSTTPATVPDLLEHVFAPSMQEQPCYMPFSGGAESAMWLAAGTRYARQHGRPDPIPLTLRHPGLATAEHLRAQERIVAHLGLADWERIEPDESLDLIGPLAAGALERIGPLWPAHAFMMLPLIEAARDGVFVLVTGASDFFAWWRWAPLTSVLQGRRRPRRSDLMLLGAALLPVWIRARLLARRDTRAAMDWLTPAARREVAAQLLRRAADVPLRCDRAVAVQSTHRCFAGASGTIEALGRLAGTRIDQPLSRPGMMEMFSAAAGRHGFDGLRPVLRWMCGDLLPSGLLSTGRGPDLTPVFFTQASRDFARRWNGTGLDDSIVDPSALRRTWLSDRPDPRTACLLQYAWLTDRARAGSLVPTTT